MKLKVVVKMMQGQAIVTWLCHRPGRCSAVDGIQSEATLSLIEGGAIIVRRESGSSSRGKEAEMEESGGMGGGEGKKNEDEGEGEREGKGIERRVDEFFISHFV